MTSNIHRLPQDPLRSFCRLAGAPDVETYLGVTPGMSVKDAMVQLEKKRREQESALSDPKRAREAELFLELYDHMREHLHRDPSSGSATASSAGDSGASAARRSGAVPVDTPDYYAVLGVAPNASYADIERAWRGLQAGGRSPEPVAAQAWRVLGDPLNRANYDRSRREEAMRSRAPISAGPPPSGPPPAHGRHNTNPDGTAATSVSVEGPDVHVVELDPTGAPSVVTVSFLVEGTGRWRGTLDHDHPALTTRPERVLTVPPGRHTFAVEIDPAKVPTKAERARITLGNTDEQHVVFLDLRRPRRKALAGLGAYAVAAAGVAVLALGALLGSWVTVTVSEPPPASVGDIYQLPRVNPCFADSAGPLPTHLDVHTDGFGHPTGYSFGGVASQAAEECVRTVLQRLEFPPTGNGLPTYYRYRIAPPASP
ncbi:MAG: hypothetical protein H6732_08720 [Alphaproteobacteria bacterium]|nr:hypothetical protein [Alphaproteobacteria bacterium]